MKTKSTKKITKSTRAKGKSKLMRKAAKDLKLPVVEGRHGILGEPAYEKEQALKKKFREPRVIMLSPHDRRSAEDCEYDTGEVPKVVRCQQCADNQPCKKHDRKSYKPGEADKHSGDDMRDAAILSGGAFTPPVEMPPLPEVEDNVMLVRSEKEIKRWIKDGELYPGAVVIIADEGGKFLDAEGRTRTITREECRMDGELKSCSPTEFRLKKHELEVTVPMMGTPIGELTKEQLQVALFEQMKMEQVLSRDLLRIHALLEDLLP